MPVHLQVSFGGIPGRGFLRPDAVRRVLQNLDGDDGALALGECEICAVAKYTQLALAALIATLSECAAASATHSSGGSLSAPGASQQVLPEDTLLDVHYEDLVENQEATTRKMLEFVGLPFEEGVLNFHENTASVVTASVAQVREKEQIDPVRENVRLRWVRDGLSLLV
jgi:hypothetical protein